MVEMNDLEKDVSNVTLVKMIAESRNLIRMVGKMLWEADKEDKCKVGDKVVMVRFDGEKYEASQAEVIEVEPEEDDNQWSYKVVDMFGKTHRADSDTCCKINT